MPNYFVHLVINMAACQADSHALWRTRLKRIVSRVFNAVHVFSDHDVKILITRNLLVIRTTSSPTPAAVAHFTSSQAVTVS